MSFVHRGFLLSLFFLLPFYRSLAQVKLLAELYDIEQGLPHSYIESAAADSSGKVWVASLGGLHRFNGYDFKTFSKAESVYSVVCSGMQIFYSNLKKELRTLIYDGKNYRDSLLIQLPASSGTYLLLAQNKNKLWAASRTGQLYLVNLQARSCIKVDIPYRINFINALVLVGNELYLATDSGLVVFRDRDKTLKKPRKYFNHAITAMCLQGDNLYTLSLDKELVIFRTRDNTVRHLRRFPSGTERHSRMLHRACMIIDKSQQLYISSDQGTILYDLRTGSAQEAFFTRQNGLPILPSYPFYSLADQSGNLWFCSDIGLIRHHPDTRLFRNINLGNEKSALPYRVRVVKDINDSTFWLGLENMGLYQLQLSKKGQKLIDYSDLVNETINCIHYDSTGNLWVAANSALFVYDASLRLRKRIPQAPVWDMEESDGYMWMIRKELGICKVNINTLEAKPIDFPSNLPGNIHAWEITRDGNYFLLTTTVGLICFSISQEQYVEPPQYSALLNRLKNERLWSCVKLQDNWLISSQHAGLFLFNENGDSKQLFNNCGGFFEILTAGKYLWVINDRGLLQLNYKDLSYRILTSADGLISNQLSFMGSHVTKNGLLAICGKGGLSLADPNQIREVIKRDPISIELQELASLNTYELLEGKSVVLPYDHNSFTLNFSPINFESHLNDRFSWKLSGRDETWSVPSAHRFVSYSNLPPGKYTFEVKLLSNSSLTHSAVKVLSIEIIPPFWKTTWFMALITLVFMSGSLYLLYIWQNSVRATHLKEQNFLQTQVMALRSQINPHFMFNALNSIQSYVFKNNREEANYYIGKLSNLIRTTLELTSRHSIRIEEEYRYLCNYLEMEELRFEKRLKWKMIIDERLNQEANIPSLMIQPFVENAVVHGISSRKEGGELCVQFQPDEMPGYVSIRVIDNGKWDGQHKARKKGSKGIGLILERMKYLNSQYKTEGFIHFSNSGSGTTVYIRLPIVTHAATEDNNN